MTMTNRAIHKFLSGLALLGGLALTLAAGGCALRQGAGDVYTATASATVNPQLTPEEARRDANTRAETQARDEILAQAAQVRLPDGRSLEDVAAADNFVRGMLYDTVRDAHKTDHNPSAEGVITVTLSLEKSAVQRIVNEYQLHGGK